MELKNNSGKQFIYKEYKELIKGIKHVDILQSKSRQLTSQILLATFLAIGFIFSSHGNLLPFNRLYAVIIVCICAIVFFTYYCYLDLVFHERLHIGYFAAAFKLEKDNNWLPPIHHYMVEGKTHHGAPSRKVIFYIGSSLFGFATIGTCLVYNYCSFGNDYCMYIIITFTLGAQLLYAYLLYKMTGNFEKLMKRVLHPCSLIHKKFKITPTDKEDEDLDAEMHDYNVGYQHHYNEIKFIYKKMAVVWAGSAVAAFGYLVSGDEIGLPFSMLTGVFFLCLMATVAIVLLWFLDINIYHRILRAIFAGNILLENRCKRLSQSHHYMIQLLQTRYMDPVLIDALQYVGLSLLILLIGSIALFLNLYPTGVKSAFVITILFICASFLFELILLSLTLTSRFARFQKANPKHHN